MLALWAAAEGAWVRPSPIYFLAAGGSILLNLVANVAFVEALRTSALSFAVPLLSLTPVGAALVAMPMLGELPGPTKAVGIALVAVGALLLGAEGAGSRSPWRWARRLAGEPGAAPMAVVVICWSLVLPLDKVAVERVPPSLHGLVLTVGVGLGTLVVLAARGRLDQLARPRRRMLPLLAAGVVVSSLALVLQLLAIRVVLVGVVEAFKRALGNFVALAVGGALFGERVSWSKLLALGLMAAGAILILV